MKDVEIISVRRAEDDSGWHVRFLIDNFEDAAWVECEGYLDREWLKNALAAKVGFERPVAHYLSDVDAHDLVVGRPIIRKISSSPPPLVAEFLFSWLAPKKSLRAQLGDMQEIFELNIVRFGKRRARMLYWTQVLRAIGPGLWLRIKRLGLIAFLIDYGRSKIGW